MTHSSEDLSAVPVRVTLAPPEGESVHAPPEVQLLVRGQGTIGFAIARHRDFDVIFHSKGDQAFRFEVAEQRVQLSMHDRHGWEPLAETGGGLDQETECPYWFSLDTINRALRYGKGEMRAGCTHLFHQLPAKPKDPDEEDPLAWLADLDTAEVRTEVKGALDIWRDPVTVEPPMYVVPHDRITMGDMARGKVTVPANLSPTCQQLYDNVAGKAFVLDPDGPREPGDFVFAEAIKRSINDERGWCYKTLWEKAGEFGKPDINRTYLRITMGQNQGDSPGIPFVMEIWPVGHFSPVHNHGGADAVIKVLHGAIWVDLYPMLSSTASSFATRVFKKDDVAWISSRLNQVHMLKNNGAQEPCVTIQCYMYAENNHTHWAYFDYIDGTEIRHFPPNSDMDYLSFKAQMQREWEDWYRWE